MRFSRNRDQLTPVTTIYAFRQGESMSSKRIRASDSTRALARVESDARIRVCELFL